MKIVSNSSGEIKSLKSDNEIIIQAQKELYLGKFKFYPGLKLYSVNKLTGEVVECKIDCKILLDTSNNKKTVVRRTTIDPNKFIYLYALNLKNAKRKAKKLV